MVNLETGELPDFTLREHPEPQGYEALLDEDLMAFWQRVDAQVQEQQSMRARIEWELQRRMEERGAREMLPPELGAEDS